MDYRFKSAWDKLRETLNGARNIAPGGKDPPIGCEILRIEQVVERFLFAYSKFEECREKLLAKLKMEHPIGEMEVPNACHLADTSV